MNAHIIEDNLSENEFQNFIEDLFVQAGMSNELIDEASTVLGSLMSMKDDQFKLLAPFFIEKMQEIYRDPQQQLALAQASTVAGVKAEDLRESFNGILEAVLEEYKLSAVKADFVKQFFSVFVNAVEETNTIAKRIVDVPVEKTKEDIQLPAYAHATDAGMDIYANDDYDIGPGEKIIIPTGIKVALPRGYAILIQPRSGLSAKTSLRVANTPGLIDCGYRDEIGVIIENIDPAIKDIEYDFTYSGDVVIKSILHGASAHISKGDRIAQMRLVEVPTVHWLEVSDVSAYEGDRGGGFGSTGGFDIKQILQEQKGNEDKA